MSMDYIRKTYGIDVKRGTRIKWTGQSDGAVRLGTVKGASGQYLKIILDGDSHSHVFHPTWKLEYIDAGKLAAGGEVGT